jgi:predicted AlkP superfamily pyrophosphatase or phosphodiesterase
MTQVIIFLIDGLRPDGFEAANAPVVKHLIKNGVYTESARTVMPSITLPCHMSLFHSVPPERHGVTTNIYNPPARPVIGLFDLAKRAGLRTASFYNWEELRDISRPGSLDVGICLNNNTDRDGAGDLVLAELAYQILSSESFDLVFVYFGWVDNAGHDYGWMSPEYLHGIEIADRCIGRVLEAVNTDRLVIVTSDHGGHYQMHGTDSPEDMTIPIILHWRGAPPGVRLESSASILDITPTVAASLGLVPPREWVGHDLLAGIR